MKLVFCLMIFLCPYMGWGQAVKVLEVGDRVPDIMFQQVLNYKTATASLHQFRRKLVLLDFWAGYCAACLRKFPLLDSLQQLHRDDMAVLLISASASDKVANTMRLLARMKKPGVKALGLPVILGDTIANRLFEPPGIPFYIWLNEDLSVVAITGTEAITAANIQRYLSGGPVPASRIELDFDITQPLFIKSNAGDGETIMARSTLSAFIPGVASRSHYTLDSNQLVTKLVMSNVRKLDLVMKAYFFYDRPERFHYRYDDTITERNSIPPEMMERFTYELITPAVTRARALQYVQDDLRRWFKISARIDTVPTKCYVLEIMDGKPLTLQNTGGRSPSRIDETGNRVIKNCSLKNLAEILDAQLDLHVYNEIKQEGRLDITMPVSKNADDYRLALAGYGIKLTQTEREVPNLFIHQHQN